MGKSDDSPFSAALAKHVSAEGCQFVFNEKRVAPGQRFRFKLEGFDPVIGTVRWVVTDRVGFAFDRPLSRACQQALSEHCRTVHGLKLFLA
ncbi:hypothetical protein GCM10011349_14610 [Novosphingobium indicum]|uniref:PilZ domain-containing protein n=1 Tax=Novosphingobium indicum TaxID=462949 RepID=A0ABQ2JG58_9SPHN|nr:PilZ domain-containing protein [Novosphingobium indicum]GGN46919.1 hypothetical protein GCM10011349_14610 [Novosphingobium indicum]